MKNKLTLITLLFLSLYNVTAQDLIINLDYKNLNTTTPVESKISDSERDKIIAENYNNKIILRFINIPDKTTLSVKPGLPIKDSKTDFDITSNQRGLMINKNEVGNYTITKTINSVLSTDIFKLNITSNLITEKDKETEETILQKSNRNRQKIISAFKSNYTFAKPYDVKKDKIDLYFDENGKLLNTLPVNVDQNDIFHMHILCSKGDELNYRINVIEGEFAPVDLVFRPAEKITSVVGNSTGSSNLIVKDYTSIVLQSSPYTSEFFRFQISYDSDSKVSNGPAYSFRINKLYHVGVGISLINTNLENPNFKTISNTTDTTIRAFNGGSRTMLTFNVIWYWSVLQQSSKGNIITSGRDILKDEPTFSFRRIYPTIGVSFDNKLRENFFGGFVYEFARGGSLIGGVHYGRINQLADRNFVLGSSKFYGQDNDIKIDQIYKASIFFGVTLDTRIFNVLFGSNK